MRELTEIVFTGGPCGGKTTALAHVAASLEDVHLFTVPEAATMLINGGVQDIGDLAKNQCERFWAFERRMFEIQGALRHHWRTLALDFSRATGKPSVIIYDRAEADIQAYIGPEKFRQLMHECDSNWHDARDSYDLVVHLVTAANGAEKHYTTDNNPARWESPSEARAADERTLAAWQDHPNLVVLENTGTFENKLEGVMAAIHATVMNT